MTLTRAHLFASRLIAVAVLATAPLPALAAPTPRLSAAATRGLAFAEQRCAACHAVRANGTSPNPEAPPWEDVANRPGTSQRTLRRFLTDSHNFPMAMQFEVERRHIRDLAAWMITLQRKDYRPTR